MLNTEVATHDFVMNTNYNNFNTRNYSQKVNLIFRNEIQAISIILASIIPPWLYYSPSS